MWGIEIFVMLLMVGLNSIFAAYEIALASISLTRLHVFSENHKSGAEEALYMKNNLEGTLAGVQLGITLVGAIAAATGGAGAEEAIAPLLQTRFGVSPGVAEFLAIVCVVLPLTVTTIIFGELIPKVFALRNKEWVCLRLSPLMRLFVFSVWPVVWLLEHSVTGLIHLASRFAGRKASDAGQDQAEAAELQELRASVALARTSRLIGPQEEKIILGAAALSHRPIREAMLPADAIRMLNLADSVADALIFAHMDMHTRFPVTNTPGNPQGIVGYVNFKDLVACMRLSPFDVTLQAIMRSIPSISEGTPIATGMQQLIRDYTHIALIRDQQNSVIGMVTLEDIMEELVGDIEDEFDRLPNQIVKSGVGWVVGGGVSFEKLRQSTLLQIPEMISRPTLNLSQWLEELLPGKIQGGEIVERDGLRIVIRKVRRQHVLEAQIQLSQRDHAN